MTSFLDSLAKVRKALAAAVGTALVVLTSVEGVPFLPATWHAFVVSVVAVLTVAATYLVPNQA